MTERALTIGNFDGCHLGHQALFRTLKSEAKELNLIPTVVSFEPHTNYVLKKIGDPPLLTTTEEKKDFVESLGLDFITLPFTEELAHLPYDIFIKEELCKKLNMKAIYFGHDHHFGALGKGNYKNISREFPEIKTKQLSIVLYKGERISSSAVRNALIQGDVSRAGMYLGRPYRLTGNIVKGKELGRVLGFPTANLDIPPYKFLPKFGVYAASARFDDGRVFRATVNIGMQPSCGICPLRIEAHLLHFSEDVYGKHLALDLLAFLRPEKKFSSLEDLKQQIASDVALAEDFDSPFSDKEFF